MLSVLIPVYNFDVRDLVHEIHHQASASGVPFEIILLDDASKDYKQYNSELSRLANVHYNELEHNVGRAIIRNRLAASASYNSLLFLDCDSKIESADFISIYLRSSSPSHIVYGGRSYEKQRPEDSRYFRWLYGVKREVSTAEDRAKRPYRSFMTNNFLIPKSFFKKVKFNESLTGYGHEDTLFGQELKLHGLPIRHIDNPLCHVGLETAEDFIRKTEEGVKNLAYLVKMKLIRRDVTLLKSYRLLKRSRTLGLFKFFAGKAEQNMLKNLKSADPDLTIFDLYKLHLLARFLSENTEDK